MRICSNGQGLQKVLCEKALWVNARPTYGIAEIRLLWNTDMVPAYSSRALLYELDQMLHLRRDISQGLNGL